MRNRPPRPALATLCFLMLGLVLAPAIALPQERDNTVQGALERYLVSTARHGSTRDAQGVWMQSAESVLLHHRGAVPLTAASLTKVATTLAALYTWGPSHRFPTVVGIAGAVRGGVLQGDLVVRGGSDPFFVWEDAIILGNTLERAGIRRVDGRLLIVGAFYMNFVLDPAGAGGLLRQALSAAAWPSEAMTQYHTLPRYTAKPEIDISGPVQVVQALPQGYVPIVRHDSLPLFDILKRMNVYSNNAMAEMLTIAMGGSDRMRQTAGKAAGVDPKELRLNNGSGLGQTNRISPRAVCALFIATHQFLQLDSLGVSDVFPVAGRDSGTVEGRDLPALAAVKTGTLDNVSTLGGVIFTREHGPVWFALLNRGTNRSALRAQQDTLLQHVTRSWGGMEDVPSAFRPLDLEMEFVRDTILSRP
ncbi:MAG: D-alanyl-D-alanine carboxypeptidase [Candidatus Tectomicrobia bacterium]|nr:D-alanyl-D-alanine carboxypeptidase [Candidatus Tectomicrobia bacterium]